MLEIVTSRDPLILEDRAVSALTGARADAPALLLVPAQASFLMERRAAELVGGLLFSSVKSFERLVSDILGVCGGRAMAGVDTIGYSLLAREAIMGEELEIIDPKKDPEAHIRVAELITSLKEESLTPDELRELAKNAPGATAKKLCDCARVWERMQRDYAGIPDSGDLEAYAMELLPAYPGLASTRVTVYGFDTIPRRRAAFIEALSRVCDVCVLALCERGSELTGAQYDAMRMLCESAGGTMHEDESTAARPRELSHLAAHLYSYPTKIYEADAPGVTLTQRRTRREEAQTACDEMLRLCAQDGLRMRDIAVLVGDLPRWQSTLSEMFTQNGIPHYLAAKRPALESSAASFMLSALLCADGFKLYELKRHIKTGLTPLTDSEADALLRYVRENGINGSQLTRPFTREDAPEELRAKAMEGLLSFAEAVKEKSDAQIIDALRAYIDGVQMKEQLEAQAAALAEAGFLQLSRFTSQLYDKLCALLSQAKLLLHGRSALPQLAAVLSGGMSACAIATTPPMADEVTVGDATHSIISGAKAVFVLGVNEGILPQNPEQDLLFSARETEELKKECPGFPSAPTADERKASLLRSLAVPQKLYFSCNAEDGLPSVLMHRLTRLFPAAHSIAPHFPATARGGLTALARSLRQDPQSELAKAYSADETGKKLLKNILPCAEASGAPVPLSEAAAKALYQELNGSASLIENFYRCPYRHFIDYGLCPDELQEFDESAADAGSYIHDLMNSFTRSLKADRASWSELSDEDIDERLARAAEFHAGEHNRGIFVKSRRFAYEESYLRRDAAFAAKGVRAHFSGLDAQVAASELPFGFDGEFFIDTPSGPVKLRGRIDRIDIAEANGERFLRIVDYKTGDKKFDLSALYYGTSIQLMIYLIAAAERFARDPVTPAGGFFFSLRAPLINDGEERSFRMSGFLLAEPAAAEALDPAGSGKLLSMSINVKPDSETPFGKDGFTRDEMRALMAHTRDVIAQAAKRILGGELSLSPAEQNGRLTCDFCEYAAICRADESCLHPLEIKPVGREDFARTERGEHHA